MNGITDFKKEIITLIRAKYPIIAVESVEEARVLTVLEQIAGELQKSYIPWSATEGLAGYGEQETKDPIQALSEIKKMKKGGGDDDSTSGMIIVLKDFHRYLTTQTPPQIIRFVRDLYGSIKGTKATLVITCPQIDVPLELQKSIAIIRLPMPGKDELRTIFNNALESMKLRKDKGKNPADKKVGQMLKEVEDSLTSENIERLLNAALGLTCDEWENIVARCFVQRNISPDLVLREKEQIIRKSGVLQIQQTQNKMEDVGGLDELKNWIRKARKRFTKEAESYGLEKPRGILFVGPPGTGKSLTAKVIAKELDLPLVRLDMADIASKWYGETTSRLRQALDVASAIAPAVFMWDEVEKMFSTGQGGDSGGHEETMRAMSTMLTDFEENPAPLLRVATCNSPFGLKAELMQRFERIFFIDLPNTREREAIFAIHIRIRGRDPAKFDLKKLAIASDDFAGREIRNVIREALVDAFDEGKEVSTDHILKQINNTIPMARQKEDEIDRMREWAAMNCIPASSIYLPDKDELMRIITRYLIKLRRDVSQFDIERISAAADGFTDVEIRAIMRAIVDGTGGNITTNLIVETLQSTIPASKQKGKSVYDIMLMAKREKEKAKSVASKRVDNIEIG